MTPPAQTVLSDWQAFSLGDLLKFSNGINADKSAYGSGAPFANVLEVINNESLEMDDIPGRVNLPRKVMARYEVQHGDILFNRTSETQEEVGLASVYFGHEPIAFGGFVFRGRPLTSHLDLDYSKYALRTAEVRNQITARGQGGIRANVSQRDLKDVTVTLPPVPEQRVIAEALDDASNHIRLLERFIAKKYAIKQGMMQQLLTGRTRFPGFREPLALGVLGDIADVVMGQSPVGTSYNRDGVGAPLINGPTEFTNWHPVARQWTTAPVRFCEPRDVLICVRGSSTGRMNIADQNYCIGRGVAAVRAQRGNDQNYVRYALSSVVEELLKLQSGSTFPSIDSRVIRGGVIFLPEPSEQKVIGEALSDADDEIHALRARIDKALAVKQGMMQQLFTGRTRLPVQETVA